MKAGCYLHHSEPEGGGAFLDLALDNCCRFAIMRCGASCGELRDFRRVELRGWEFTNFSPE
jgi:hypothetical protein